MRAAQTGAGDPGADREYRRELMRQIGELERQVAYYTRHRIVGAPEPPPRKPAGQLLPATELMAVRNELADYVQTLRLDEEERLELIAADKRAEEEQELAERTEEIRTAGRRSRGTAVNPPQCGLGTRFLGPEVARAEAVRKLGSHGR